MNRTLSPHGYFQLLCEAHIVLRTSCRQLTWKEGPTAEAVASTKEKFLENCLLLANYYFMQPKDWRLALPYFRMSGLAPLEVLRQAKEVWLEAEKQRKVGRL